MEVQFLNGSLFRFNRFLTLFYWNYFEVIIYPVRILNFNTIYTHFIFFILLLCIFIFICLFLSTVCFSRFIKFGNRTPASYLFDIRRIIFNSIFSLIEQQPACYVMWQTKDEMMCDIVNKKIWWYEEYSECISGITIMKLTRFQWVYCQLIPTHYMKK